MFEKTPPNEEGLVKLSRCGYLFVSGEVQLGFCQSPRRGLQESSQPLYRSNQVGHRVRTLCRDHKCTLQQMVFQHVELCDVSGKPCDTHLPRQTITFNFWGG